MRFRKDLVGSLAVLELAVLLTVFAIFCPATWLLWTTGALALVALVATMFVVHRMYIASYDVVNNVYAYRFPFVKFLISSAMLLAVTAIVLFICIKLFWLILLPTAILLALAAYLIWPYSRFWSIITIACIFTAIIILANYGAVKSALNEGITLKDMVVNTLTVTGDVNVDGDENIKGDQNVGGNQNVEGDSNIKGDQNVGGNQTVEKDQTVKGNQTVEKDQIVKGNQTVEGDSNVKGDLNVDGDVNVGGNINTSKKEDTSSDTGKGGGTSSKDDSSSKDNTSSEKPKHTHSYTKKVTAPTCTEKGYTTYTCKCGDTYKGDYKDATGHTYSKKVTAPTCTAKGYTTYTCKCGDTYKGNYKDALGHSYTTKVIAPTTAAGGYTLHTCSRCNHSYKDAYTDKLPTPVKPAIKCATTIRYGETLYVNLTGISASNIKVSNKAFVTVEKISDSKVAITLTEDVDGYITVTDSVSGTNVVIDIV